MNPSQKFKRAFISGLLITCFTLSGLKMKGQDSSFANEPEKAGYAMGVNIAEKVANGLEKQGIDSISGEAIARGLIDNMSEKEELQIEKDNAKKIIRSYFQKVQKRKQEANQREGKKFMKQKRSEEGVKRTESGLTYKPLEEGSGPKPDRWDSVKVHYQGSKINGEVFESSFDRGEAIAFSANGKVVKGWTEALQMMNEGSKWKLFLPPDLAYGKRGKGKAIGPSETLVFKLQLKEVIEVDSAEAAQSQGKKRRGGGLSPAQKRRLRKQMQQRRGGDR